MSRMKRLGRADKFLATRSSLLLRLQQQGNESAWQQFYELYAGLIYSAACKSGLSTPDAEDVVQESLMTILHDLPRYDRARGSFKNWLMHITRFRIADRFRQLERVHRVEADLGSNGTSLEQHPDPAVLMPDEAWELSWKDNLAEMALAELRHSTSARQFQYFHCCVVEGMKPREVARALHAPRSMIYLAKFRLMQRYKKIMERLEKRDAQLG